MNDLIMVEGRPTEDGTYLFRTKNFDKVGYQVIHIIEGSLVFKVPKGCTHHLNLTDIEMDIQALTKVRGEMK